MLSGAASDQQVGFLERFYLPVTNETRNKVMQC